MKIDIIILDSQGARMWVKVDAEPVDLKSTPVGEFAVHPSTGDNSLFSVSELKTGYRISRWKTTQEAAIEDARFNILALGNLQERIRRRNASNPPKPDNIPDYDSIKDSL